VSKGKLVCGISFETYSGVVSMPDLIIPALSRENYLFTCSPI